MINTRKLGSEYENKISNFAESKGMLILNKNYRTRSGEIDLIVKDKDTYVFVEVKYRKNTSSGSAASSVTTNKKKRISKCALSYISTNNLSLDNKYRFDVVAIDGKSFKWYKNAFEFYKGINI